jgi:hypothetical protein
VYQVVLAEELQAELRKVSLEQKGRQELAQKIKAE